MCYSVSFRACGIIPCMWYHSLHVVSFCACGIILCTICIAVRSIRAPIKCLWWAPLYRPLSTDCCMVCWKVLLNLLFQGVWCELCIHFGRLVAPMKRWWELFTCCAPSWKGKATPQQSGLNSSPKESSSIRVNVMPILILNSNSPFTHVQDIFIQVLVLVVTFSYI